MSPLTLPDVRLLRTVAALVGRVCELEARALTFDRLHALTPLLDGPTRRMVFDRLDLDHADACWTHLAAASRQEAM
jgi:hypothetical protein